MDVYIGFDISLQTTYLCVVDSEGTIVREGTAPSEVHAVDDWLRRHNQGWSIQRIVFESGQLSTHFYHGLRASWPVICIDVRHAHGTLKAQWVKTDKHDARGLAQIGRTGGISKCGNSALRTLLFEASVTMLTRSGKWSRLKSWAVRLAQRTNFKVASTALSRKLAVVMHRMWVDGTDFAYGEPPAMAA